MPRLTPTLAVALTLATGSTLAHADVTVPGDVVVSSGTTLTISDNTTYTGSLTLEAGATVDFDGAWELRIADGATLTANGTQTQRIQFNTGAVRMHGLRFQPGSVGVLHGVDFLRAQTTAVYVSGGDVVESF